MTPTLPNEWIKCFLRMPDCEKVLAICKSEPETFYNLRANGWFRDTIYACRMIKLEDQDKFIIESYGPVLPATHWMPLPNPPKE